MINKIKENNTLYIRRCNHCKSVFSYDAQDYASNYGYGNEYGLIRCPYCEHKNKIKFKIRYRSSKKVNQDYKAELDKVKNRNEELKAIVEKLESNNNKLKSNVIKYEDIESLYNQEKKISNEYRNKYTKAHDKIIKVSLYIDDYMFSGKRNNLATKYLKEIQELIK